jgi:dihydrofolate reductase
MGTITSNFFVSLDGVVEPPDLWHYPYFSDQMGDANGERMATTEAFLMGRDLYEERGGYWPTNDDEPFASIVNNMPKYVVSSTLTDATWNKTTIITGDLPAAIRDLKNSAEGDITMSGSATLVRWLLANGLLDRLNLMVHPNALGKGQHLFEDIPTHPLQLESDEVFTTGVLKPSRHAGRLMASFERMGRHRTLCDLSRSRGGKR